MNEFAMEVRAIRIIESCHSRDQLRVARAWAILLRRRIGVLSRDVECAYIKALGRLCPF